MLRISRLLDYVSRALAIGSSIAVLAIVAVISVDAGSRLTTGRSLAGAVEYAETLMVTVIALGLAEGQRRGTHVSMDLLVVRLRSRTAALWRLATYSAGLTLVVWMAFRGIDLAWQSFLSGEYRFGLRRVVLWPGKAAMAIGLTALAAELARTMIGHLAVIVSGNRANNITRSLEYPKYD